MANLSHCLQMVIVKQLCQNIPRRHEHLFAIVRCGPNLLYHLVSWPLAFAFAVSSLKLGYVLVCLDLNSVPQPPTQLFIMDVLP